MSRVSRFSKSISNFLDDGQDIVLDTLGLTAAELAQLQNINSSAISSTEWGYLASLNQNLTTTSNVVFAQAVVNGKIQLNTNNKLYLTDNNASHYLSYNGSVDGVSGFGSSGCRFGYISAGNEVGVIDITSAGCLPVTTNTFDLGSASKEFQDLFLVNSPTVSSDIRLKKNIEPLNNIINSYDIINAVSPVKFQYNKRKQDFDRKGNMIRDEEFEKIPKDRYGFIAQELLAVLPENNTIVYEKEDKMLGLRPSELIPILWDGMKRLIEEIEQLKKSKK